MERTKVLHITQCVGGVETYLRHVVLNIERKRFEIIIASSEGSIKQFCEEQGITHYHLNMSRGFNFFNDIGGLFSIYNLIKKEKPSLVHLHSSKAGFLGRIAAHVASCKSLFTPHGGSYLSFSGFRRMMFFMLELIGKKFTHKILCISNSEANRFIHEVGIKAEKIHVIPNALTITQFQAEIPGKSEKLPGKIKIGTIGRITHQKNPLLFADIAFDITRKFSGAHFYFLGAGFHDHLKKEFEEKIKEYGIETNLHLIKKGDHLLAVNLLQEIDIFLLPSVYEGLSYALLEAMLQEVPCVVSKCEGNNDVINNNDNGFACLTREEYTKVISFLITNKEKAKEIGKRGREYVIKNHDIKKNIKLLEELYAQF